MPCQLPSHTTPLSTFYRALVVGVWSWVSSIGCAWEPITNANYQAPPRTWRVKRRGEAQQSLPYQALQVILPHPEV